AMATPPSMAIGRRCQRSARGCATRPIRTARRRHNGTSARARTNATRNGLTADIVKESPGRFDVARSLQASVRRSAKAFALRRYEKRRKAFALRCRRSRIVPHERTGSSRKSAFQQGVHGVDAVDPSNLLAFVGPARLVADRHFQDSMSGAQKPRRDLRLEIEPDRA